MLTGVDTFVIKSTDHRIFEQSIYVSQIQMPPGQTVGHSVINCVEKKKWNGGLRIFNWWSFCVFAESERRQQ